MDFQFTQFFNLLSVYAAHRHKTSDCIGVLSFLEYSGLINKPPFLILFTLYNCRLTQYLLVSFFPPYLVHSINS